MSDRSKWHPQWASYNAYLIQKNGKTLFFGWDTTYTEAMKSYAPNGGVDIAIMPIGSYDRPQHHCNPEQALQMAHMLGSRNIIGIHRDARGRPAKREWDVPLTWLINSAPKYDMDVLWKYEGEVVVSPPPWT
jgi:L-ascorbate metabolism protein UlaG (beta-lactamase superfamily)